MSWWLIEDYGIPLYLERHCGSTLGPLDIAARFVSSSDAVRMRNFCLAIPRMPTVSFGVIGVDISFQVRSDYQSNVSIVISPKELRAIDEASAVRLACFIEQRLCGCPSIDIGRGRKITIDPNYELASNDERISHPFQVILSGVQYFPDLNPTQPISANLDLLNKEYAFEGVNYYEDRVRLRSDPSIGLSVIPMTGWGGGGALEEGVYLICWAQYPGNGGQQLTGGYTDCILARIPTASSETGFERSPYVWGEVQRRGATIQNPDNGIFDTSKSIVGILTSVGNWIGWILKKLVSCVSSKHSGF